MPNVIHTLFYEKRVYSIGYFALVPLIVDCVLAYALIEAEFLAKLRRRFDKDSAHLFRRNLEKETRPKKGFATEILRGGSARTASKQKLLYHKKTKNFKNSPRRYLKF